MPHRRILTRDDINAIKQLRNRVNVSEIADRYKISYQRIYKIWKSDELVGGGIFDSIVGVPVERVIDAQHEQTISQIINTIVLQRVDDISDKINDRISDRINDSETTRRLQHQVDKLTDQNKSLREKLSTARQQQISANDS